MSMFSVDLIRLSIKKANNFNLYMVQRFGSCYHVVIKENWNIYIIIKSEIRISIFFLASRASKNEFYLS